MVGTSKTGRNIGLCKRVDENVHCWIYPLEKLPSEGEKRVQGGVRGEYSKAVSNASLQDDFGNQEGRG